MVATETGKVRALCREQMTLGMFWLETAGHREIGNKSERVVIFILRGACLAFSHLKIEMGQKLKEMSAINQTLGILGSTFTERITVLSEHF